MRWRTHDDFQNAVDRVPAGDMLIVAGGWNARPGSVGMATRRILGKFALGTRCANGDRLVDFASTGLKQAVNMQFGSCNGLCSTTHEGSPDFHTPSQAQHGKTENSGAGTFLTGYTGPFWGFTARRGRHPGGQMARAQGRSCRRFQCTSRKNAPSGHCQDVEARLARIQSATNHFHFRARRLPELWYPVYKYIAYLLSIPSLFFCLFGRGLAGVWYFTAFLQCVSRLVPIFAARARFRA